MLKNAESKAEFKGLDVDSGHGAPPGDKAPKTQCRICRAHGWVNPPPMRAPCNPGVIPSEKEQIAPKPEEEVAQKAKISQEKLKKQKLMTQEEI